MSIREVSSPLSMRPPLTSRLPMVRLFARPCALPFIVSPSNAEGEEAMGRVPPSLIDESGLNEFADPFCVFFSSNFLSPLLSVAPKVPDEESG